MNYKVIIDIIYRLKVILFILCFINYEIIIGFCVRFIVIVLFVYKFWSCWFKYNWRNRYLCGVCLLFYEIGFVKNVVKIF